MATVTKVLNGGLGIISARIAGTGTEPKNLTWGTGATAATVADTGLQTAAAETSVGGSSSVTNAGGKTGDTYQVVATQTCSGSSKNITEFVLKDTAGTGFMRSTFTAIGVDPGDSIAFTAQAIGTTV